VTTLQKYELVTVLIKFLDAGAGALGLRTSWSHLSLVRI
jgi:hypothetical protein